LPDVNILPKWQMKSAGFCVWPRGMHLVMQNDANLSRKDYFSAVFDSFDVLKGFVTFWQGL